MTLAAPSTPAAWLREQLPDPVLMQWAAIEPRWDDLLHSEREAVRHAVSARRHEFAAGRRLARDLLARLGLGAVALPRGADRQPCWPRGIRGSISHAAGHCLVAVAAADADSTVPVLGVDHEAAEPLADDLIPIVTSGPAELSATGSAHDLSRGHAAKLLFCAKEAAFKAQFPRTGRMLEFHDLEIDWLDGSQRFRARPRVGGVPSTLGSARSDGRWVVAAVSGLED